MQFKLTPRENTILSLVAKGYSYKEIAFELKISKSYIAARIWKFKTKYNFKNTEQLMYILGLQKTFETDI